MSRRRAHGTPAADAHPIHNHRHTLSEPHRHDAEGRAVNNARGKAEFACAGYKVFAGRPANATGPAHRGGARFTFIHPEIACNDLESGRPAPRFALAKTLCLEREMQNRVNAGACRRKHRHRFGDAVQ